MAIIIVFFFLKTVSDNVRLIQRRSNLEYLKSVGGIWKVLGEFERFANISLLASV